MKKFIARLLAVLGGIIIMPVTVLLIFFIYMVKFFRYFSFKDPFHNSRQHPLNSPEAPRG